MSVTFDCGAISLGVLGPDLRIKFRELFSCSMAIERVEEVGEYDDCVLSRCRDGRESYDRGEQLHTSRHAFHAFPGEAVSAIVKSGRT